MARMSHVRLDRARPDDDDLQIVGEGPPLLMIPGIQGRREWMQPAVDAMAREFRVVSFSLHGEPGSRRPFDPEHRFDVQLEQVDDALDRAGVERTAICGVSYGGWVALMYAATRPHRVESLVLVSTPPPNYEPNPRVARYVEAPMRSAPAFVVKASGRLLREVAAALPDWRMRARFTFEHLRRVMGAPMSPTRMAWRMKAAREVDFVHACGCIAQPTLIVTGQPDLDAVVPVEHTRRYADLIRHAEVATLERTGHVGLVTKPEAFATLVGTFLTRHASTPGAATPQDDPVRLRVDREAGRHP